MKVSYFAILFFLCFKAMAIEIYPSSQGAIGDGIADDTIAIQKTLTLCSQQNAICRLPKGKFFRITQPLFMWGASQLIGTNSGFIFDVATEPYLLNFGISSKKTTSANNLQAPFTGVINSVHFRVASGAGGRVLYFWRTRGAKILNNRFEVGSLNYSATSSGNNDNWVGAANCIRENIEIINIIKKYQKYNFECTRKKPKLNFQA